MKHDSVDLSLFSKIQSQQSTGDKVSFLTILRAHARIFGEFCYLEIGSHLGGSIAPVLQQTHCRKVYSIDKRPQSQNDDTGQRYYYPGNSTERMMQNLRNVDPASDSKVLCIDGDTSTISIPEFDLRPSICFIDGEHTDAIVFRDYKFCRKVIQDNGTLIFHDANTIYLTLRRIVSDLDDEGICFEAFCLADTMFVISFGPVKISEDQAVLALMRNGGGYLPSLVINDHYRQFKNRKIFRLFRSVLKVVS
jgi:hypothetical protein